MQFQVINNKNLKLKNPMEKKLNLLQQVKILYQNKIYVKMMKINFRKYK